MNNYYHLNKVHHQDPLHFDGVYMAQIGRLFCKRDTVIDAHFHTDLYELTVVTDGKGIVTTNSVATHVKKGDIYISFPCDIHKIESDHTEPLKYDFFAFRTSDARFTDALTLIATNRSSERNRTFTDERIHVLIGQAIAELNAENSFANDVLTAVFRQILVYTIRGLSSDTDNDNSCGEKSPAEILCYSLMNYIDTHLYTMRSLRELETVSGYSYGYLSNVFTKTTSQSLSAYYQKKKLYAAALLLTENKLSVTQLAELFNYSSPFAFSKAFKNEFGVSPKYYRQSPSTEATKRIN
jgi:AraC-like DNA-binding protein